MKKKSKIGVLSIQGSFSAHCNIMEMLKIPWFKVRSVDQLQSASGLILPGGESTTMLKFIFDEGFSDALRHFSQNGGCFFGTCSGAILLASKVVNPNQPALKAMDIEIKRNAYGRQINSFIDKANCKKLGRKPFEIICIRSPMITRVGKDVDVLMEHQGKPILVKQGRNLAATFHPELTKDTRIHRYFYSLVQNERNNI